MVVEVSAAFGFAVGVIAVVVWDEEREKEKGGRMLFRYSTGSKAGSANTERVGSRWEDEDCCVILGPSGGPCRVAGSMACGIGV